MITVRRETPEDIAAVHDLVEAAFARPDEAGGVDAVRRNGGATLSLVAEVDGVIAGHILFSPVTVGSGASAFEGLGLAPLAVLPRFQGQGVGSALVRAGLEECRAMGTGFVVVLGHPTYYPRFGFLVAVEHGLRCPFDAPDEAFMVIELVDGFLAGRGGLVRYREEWDGM